MALKERVNDDLKAAMLSGNRFVADTLRGLKAAILNEEVATGSRETGLADEAIEKVIAREVKKRTESAKLYADNGREDLAEPEVKEIEILSEYLPEQKSEDEIRAVVQQKIVELGVSGPAAMGQVIGAVKQELGNTADGATIASIVKQELVN